MLAVENGHPDIVKTLLDRGADVDLKDSYDRTALDIAVQTEHPEIIEILQRALDIKSEKQSP